MSISSFNTKAQERASTRLFHQEGRGSAFHFVDLSSSVRQLRLSSSPRQGRPQKLLQTLSLGLAQTLRRCNPQYTYESKGNPKRVLTKPSEPAFGTDYDNCNHDLIIHVNDIFSPDPPGIGPQYQVIDLLGQGTFGQVVKCVNQETGEAVAVKVVKNKPAYANQGLVELKIVRQLNREFDPEDTEHIVRLRDHFKHRGHLCLVFELLSINLYELIKMNSHRGFSMNLLRIFLKQIIEAQMVLQAARCIHCDLKPENILLCDLSAPHIKLIDFGSACYEGRTVFSYIQSRFYRSPEVILGVSYSAAIDIWSIGCIAAELFFGLPLFPGHSEANQLSRIVEMLGPPPEWMLQQGKNSRKYYQITNGVWALKSEAQVAAESGGRTRSNATPTKKYFLHPSLPENIRHFPRKAGLTPEQIQQEDMQRQCLAHFLLGLLRLDPRHRWTPDQAIEHPFLTGSPFHPSWEPPAPRRSQTQPVPMAMNSGNSGMSDSSFSPRTHFMFQLGTSPSTNFSPATTGFLGQSPSTSKGFMNMAAPNYGNSHPHANRAFSLPTQNYGYVTSGTTPNQFYGSGMGPHPAASFSPATAVYQQKQYPSDYGSPRSSFTAFNPKLPSQSPTFQPAYRSQQRPHGGSNSSGSLSRSGSHVNGRTSPYSPGRSPFKGSSGGSSRSKKAHRRIPSYGNSYQNESPRGRSSPLYAGSASDSSNYGIYPGGSFGDDIGQSPSPRHGSRSSDSNNEYEAPFYFEDSEPSLITPNEPYGVPIAGSLSGNSSSYIPDSSTFQLGTSPMTGNGFPGTRHPYDNNSGARRLRSGSFTDISGGAPHTTQSYLDPSIFPFRVAANSASTNDESSKWKKVRRRSGNG